MGVSIDPVNNTAPNPLLFLNVIQAHTFKITARGWIFASEDRSLSNLFIRRMGFEGVDPVGFSSALGWEEMGYYILLDKELW